MATLEAMSIDERYQYLRRMRSRYRQADHRTKKELTNVGHRFALKPRRPRQASGRTHLTGLSMGLWSRGRAWDRCVPARWSLVTPTA